MANSEVLIPIPGRLHSVATEGHVAGADEIYDDQLAKNQETLNADSAYLGNDEGQAVIPDFDPDTDTLHVKAQTLTTAKKDAAASNIFDKGASNGMARVVLKATDDFKTVVESATGGNTIFVIQYDYTLSSDVTIPANCVLKFEGGSISGTYTLTFTNTEVSGDVNITCALAGTLKNAEIDPRWFGVKGDGVTYDSAAFQKVFNLVSGQNKTVLLPQSSGNYILDSSILIRSNTIFKGLGGVLKLKDGYTQAGATQYVLFNLDQNNVTIDGIIIDGNSANQTASATVCDLITLLGERSRVINCKLYNSPDSGIMFSAVKDGECCNNYIDGAKDLCIYVNDGSTDSSDMERCLISKNILKNGLAGGIAIKRRASKLIISENIVESCSNGITLERASTNYDYGTNLQIVNNFIRNTTNIGIQIFESNYVLCSSNRLESIKNTGILIAGSEYCSISDNIIVETDITYTPGSTSALLMFREAVPVEGGDYFIGKNITISNNVTKALFESPMRCFKIGSTVGYLEKSIINGNIFSGISAVNFSGFIKSSIISNNQFLDSTDTYGAYLTGDNTNTFNANKFSKTPYYGTTNYGSTLGTFANRPTNPTAGYQYLIIESNRVLPIWWNGFGWYDGAGNVVTA